MKKLLYLVILIALSLTLFTGLSFFIKNNTIPNDLGLKDGQLSELKDTPNGVASITMYEDKAVEALGLKNSATYSKELIKELLQNLDDNTLITEGPYYLHYVFASDKMGFNDDVEFFFDQASGVIHYRSQSRVGVSDMGINLKRYENIRDLYKETE